MARISIRTAAFCVAIILATLTVAACSSSANSAAYPTPRALPTPRPLPEHATLHDAIAWLDEAGLVVEIIGNTTADDPSFSFRDITQVSVNGYESVWIAEYYQAQGMDRLADHFTMYADYSVDKYPTLITIANLVFLIRGAEADAIYEVLAAIWDKTPPTETSPFGLTNFDIGAEDVSDAIAEWLAERPETSGFTQAPSEPVLTTMQGFAHVYGFDALVSNLPHPGSPVWVTEFINTGAANAEESRYLTVVSELVSGMPVAEVRTSTPLDLSAIEPIPPPEISQMATVDGADGEYDELHTMVQWRGGRTLLYASENWPEGTRSYVIERTAHSEENWQPIAWLRHDAWDMTQERPARFVPPAGRAEADYSGDDRMPLLSYWDYDVEPGVEYDYRVYGCTSLGRQTSYSEVVSATGGDPDPSTPDPGAHVSSVVEPDCSREAD